jgi:endonuclease/exonuclease/phosphatase (EEP) superfamily protein YafD
MERTFPPPQPERTFKGEARDMIARMRSSVAAAGLLVAVLGGCASQEKKPVAQAPPPTPSQRMAAQASAADQQLATGRRQLEAARQTSLSADAQQSQVKEQLATAEQKSSEAQARVAQEQANVRRLEASSTELHAQAEQAAIQEQLAAEEAMGLQSVSGRIAAASPGRVLLQGQGGRSIAFEVNPKTKVLVGSQQRSIAELQQGAEARVAFDPRADQMSAAVIHVKPAKRTSTAPQQPQGQPQQ